MTTDALCDVPLEVRQSYARSRSLRVGPQILAGGSPTGPLAGTSTVVKDLFAIEGHRIGAGNPDWLAAARIESSHAWAVKRWTDAGASVIGIAHSDELAFSLSGTNVHYGTPVNAAAPEHVPGGSSSGSVAAVAAGLVDYALATDTAGSTRVPASYCGTFGVRTTHGRIPMTGVVPLAPFFDTVGVLAATGEALQRAATVLLEPGAGPKAAAAPPTEIVLATDLLALADSDTAAAVTAAARGLAEVAGVPVTEATLAGVGTLADWQQLFTVRQMADIWATHGTWVTSRHPNLGPGVTSRMRQAAAADPERARLADVGREMVREKIESTIPPGGMLAFATAAGPAPRIDLPGTAKAELRNRTIAMTCVAGLGGLPAVSLPLTTVAGLPVGVCLVGHPGDDETLLAAATVADRMLAPIRRVKP
ncbi:amidase family protein [Rhodococcus opacus]|uniref:amidase family protein n=1 Tax=Rhodococcus opacus TaxID=37919 RepID=UPI000FFB3F67|nr:amidase family protein [Rhodococcus opacus]